MSEFQSGTGPTEPEIEQIRVRIAKGDNGYSGPWYLDLRDLLAAYDVMRQQRDGARAELAEKQDVLSRGTRLLKKMNRMITQRDTALDHVRELHVEIIAGQDKGFCGGCGISYPCSTIRALSVSEGS